MEILEGFATGVMISQFLGGELRIPVVVHLVSCFSYFSEVSCSFFFCSLLKQIVSIFYSADVSN